MAYNDLDKQVHQLAGAIGHAAYEYMLAADGDGLTVQAEAGRAWAQLGYAGLGKVAEVAVWCTAATLNAVGAPVHSDALETCGWLSALAQQYMAEEEAEEEGEKVEAGRLPSTPAPEDVEHLTRCLGL